MHEKQTFNQYSQRTMNRHPADHSDNAGQQTADVLLATSPDGLVSIGDLDAMRRYLLLSSAKDDNINQPHLHGDTARNALFESANNAMVKTPDGRLMRLRLYAWPVTAMVTRTSRNPNELCLVSKNDNRIALKFRELWARVFQAQRGVLISPLAWAPHLNTVLSKTPVDVRECVRNGVALFSGRSDRVWRFAADSGYEVAAPDMPATYLFCAYVAWELGTPSPDAVLEANLKREFQTLIESLLTSHEGAQVRAFAGEPAIFHHAITNGQKEFYRALYRRSRESGRVLSMSHSLDGYHHCLTASLVDGQGEETDITISYSNLWRPMAHLTDIEEAVNDQRLAEYQANTQVRSAFDEYNPYPVARGAVH